MQRWVRPEEKQASLLFNLCSIIKSEVKSYCFFLSLCKHEHIFKRTRNKRNFWLIVQLPLFPQKFFVAKHFCIQFSNKKCIEKTVPLIEKYFLRKRKEGGKGGEGGWWAGAWPGGGGGESVCREDQSFYAKKQNVKETRLLLLLLLLLRVLCVCGCSQSC